ncbi:unnamed protein product [Triticum turgidum subsp. durum]|uniref:CRAL/TRIO N-terminal domain-containing protein n=1 Tax=Triticum turgidum subsp. durum TaxID=4567 RepID=A0A9R0W7V9_TRITD|nr:unnamed protein product [Triticum turgidum subsp. durum]
MFRKKQASHFDSDDAEQRQAKIKELKAALGPFSARGKKYCDEACLVRYLEARNWNVDKSRKMLEESIKWRAAKRPEDIRWPDVSVEAETGKMYRATFTDREGRTVVVMRPAKQQVLKVLVDPKSAQKLNFVYKENEESMKTMYSHIDPEVLPVEFGGKNNVVYNHEDYSKLMIKDDIKRASFWAADVSHVVNVDSVPEVKPQSSLIVAKAS